ncbi:VPLPA-CTERM sorting domain-containing protein [Tropicibacter sp. S64]|uniref:VPLPA-CTERM sorting domain-containing protein n=1 Tax=Tropicibacter sp. S64 TaxID=3415122 RepID=UPI003C7ABBB0
MLSNVRHVAAIMFCLATSAIPAAAATLIARNDGSVPFTASNYGTGYGTSGDANYIAADLGTYGGDVTMKMTIGSVADFFRPASGFSLLDMLTSFDKHLWSNSAAGTFIAPAYYTNHMGGSATFWPATTIPGDDRIHIGFWGDNGGLTGACCSTDYVSSSGWGQAFTLELVSPVPLPAGLPVLAGALGILALVRRRKA